MPPAGRSTRSTSRQALPYNPVADYIDQRGPRHPRPKGEELALLKTLSKREVDALVSMDNKSRQVFAQTVDQPWRIGAVSY